MVQRLDPAVFSPGDYIIVEGEFGLDAYLIQSGVVRIPLPDGSELRRSSGECIGEVAMITSARVMEPKYPGSRGSFTENTS